MFENAEVVMEGCWLYAVSVQCNLRIIKWNTLYGSSDYEDLAEIRDDKEIECFYIEFESMIQKGMYDSSRGGFLTLLEAIIEAEKVTNQKIDWTKIIGYFTFFLCCELTFSSSSVLFDRMLGLP